MYIKLLEKSGSSYIQRDFSGTDRTSSWHNTANSWQKTVTKGYVVNYATSNELFIEISTTVANTQATTWFDDIKIEVTSPTPEQTLAADIKSHNDYYAFGMQMPGRTFSDGYRYGFNGMEKDDEVKGSGNSYKTEFRQYDPRIGKWLSVDPLASTFPWQSPYCAFDNNPPNIIDPTGQGGQSTHTDKDGNVIAVYDDGDLGVYKHDDATTREDIDKKYSKSNTGAGGEKMGETYFWDEFVNFNSGKEEGKIMFGESYDQMFKTISSQASSMSLKEIASKSSLNQPFDVKHKTEYAPHGIMTGKLFNGKYITARSAGNYLAGYNGTHSGMGLGKIRLDYEGYMKAAGYYNATGKKGFNMYMAGVFGASPYPAPTYGEDLYSVRWIARGIQNNPNEVRLRCLGCQDIMNKSSAINGYDKSAVLQKYFKR